MQSLEALTSEWAVTARNLINYKECSNSLYLSAFSSEMAVGCVISALLKASQELPLNPTVWAVPAVSWHVEAWVFSEYIFKSLWFASHFPHCSSEPRGSEIGSP